MSDVYETSKSLSEYLLFHYADGEEILPYDCGPSSALGFAIRTVAEGLDQSILGEKARALDLGCAVGRSSFELARYCEEVVGIDYSESFISAAETIKRDGAIAFEAQEEGARTKKLESALPGSIDRTRVSFEVGDALALRSDLGSFDVVHMANLLCRLRSPSLLLKRLPDLLRPGGQVIITTPCTWLEEFTPPEEWLGGSPDALERTTLEAIAESLTPAFERVWLADMPMLIRETSRKYQWTLVQASRWIRR